MIISSGPASLTSQYRMEYMWQPKLVICPLEEVSKDKPLLSDQRLRQIIGKRAGRPQVPS